MKWKDLLAELPLLLPGHLAKDNEIIISRIGDVVYAASHVYVPSLDACYSVSLRGGNHQQRKKVILSISTELGEPTEIDQQASVRYYFWPSGSEEIPETLVYKTLGKEVVCRILEKYGLGDEDGRVIKDILVLYEFLMFDTMTCIEYATSKVMPLSSNKRMAIMAAFLEINTEFARIRTA